MSTSVKAVTEMLMAQKMASILNTIMQDTGTSSAIFSWKQIGGLLAMLSIEEVRTVIADTFSFIRETIKKYACFDSVASLFDICKKACLFIVLQTKRIIFRRTIPVEPIDIMPVSRVNSVKIQLDQQLLDLIMNDKYSKDELEYHVDTDATEYEFETIHKHTRKEIWCNVKFALNSEIEAQCLTNYDVVICSDNKIKVSKNAKIIETDDYRLIPREGFGDIVNRLLTKNGDNILLYSCRDYSACSTNIIFKTNSKQKGFERYLDIKDARPSIYGYLYMICNMFKYVTKREISASEWQAITGSNSDLLNVDLIDPEACTKLLSERFNGRLKWQYELMIEQAQKGYYVEWKKYYNEDFPKPLVITYKTEEIVKDFAISKKLQISLFSKTLSATEITAVFDTYVKNIGKDAEIYSGESTPQKMYFLSINRKKEIVKVPNPDYEEWTETCKMFASAAPAATPAATPAAAMPAAMLHHLPPPPKMLSETKESTELMCKDLATCFKPIDTLYIAQADADALYSSLNIFKNQKERLRFLGIPNKYGLFLSGPPGTGKTSTVYAVATFLQKPIYYVSLNEVRTNRELSQLFDHVNAKTVGGGIIVFEDIDAMTDVVLKRTSDASTACSVIDVMSEEDGCMTLSYLLNIMDGVMSQDGMIVIATSNHPEKLDPAFLREGRFNMSINLGNANHYQINKIFTKFFERDVSVEVLEKIPAGKHTPAEFIFRCMNYILTPDVPDHVILHKFIARD